MPLPRMTSWRWMIAVAVAAVVAFAPGLWTIIERSVQYHSIMRFHAVEADRGLANMESLIGRDDIENAARLARQVEYHFDLMRKYKRAAFLPWLPAPPDPPEPK